MNNLSTKQLEQIPWLRKFISGRDVPIEPSIEEIPPLLKIPFLKRDLRFGQFYTWFEIVKIVGDKPLIILDTACGRGQICQILKFYNHEITGVDIDNCFCADKNIPFVQANLDTKFPFNNESFDVVINSTALHYLNSSEHFITESKRILKENGRLIFSLPNIESLGSRYNFVKSGKISEYSSAILERKNFLYPDYIFKLLEHFDFNILNIHGVCPIINFKIKLVDFIVGSKMFQGPNANDIWKYSNILIIEAKKN